MPYKHNESRRHKIEKARYKVTNWPEYNKALRQRGDITIWFTEEALAAWHPAKTGARGRPQEYSDLSIETALFIRQVFHLPLRQTEGFMNSLTRLMKSTISIPDYSSISKRSISLPRYVLSQAMEPGSLVIVDATGLKVYGQRRMASGEIRRCASPDLAQTPSRGRRTSSNCWLRTHHARSR